MSTNYPGIDYGMGRANIDKETGIRFGVIHINSLAHWALDEFEPEYANEPADVDECGDVQPDGWFFKDEHYQASLDSYNDVILVKSPYYTNAQFCSPCVPGAGHLDNPCPTGPKTYCFGHDWFDNKIAPYPVFDVKTGQEVKPEVKGKQP